MAGNPKDRRGWAQLIHRIERWTGRASDAEDLLQTAYERLHQYRAKHEVTKPESFLFRAAVNAGVDERRKERFIDQNFDLHEGGAILIDSAPPLDEVIAARQRLERVKEGLARLSPRTREIFLMHRLERLKYREIAERLGISQSAVEKHVAKAALFLAEWTEGY